MGLSGIQYLGRSNIFLILLAALDPLADCFSDGLEDLVVPPSIPALTQHLGAAGQDVFQCPYR